MRCDLDRELHLGRLTRHLGTVVKIDDPHARRFAYRRAGAVVDAHDDLRAADIVRARRRALMVAPLPCPTAMVRSTPVRTAPASDDLVEIMAESLVRGMRDGTLDLDDGLAVEQHLIAAGFAPLDATRAEIVGPATARARARLGRAASCDRRAHTVARGALPVLVAAVSGLVCPPAHAANEAALLTDERLFSVVTWAPFAIIVLIGLAFSWRERSVSPPVEEEMPAEPTRAARAPATAVDLADLEQRLRAADRG